MTPEEPPTDVTSGFRRTGLWIAGGVAIVLAAALAVLVIVRSPGESPELVPLDAASSTSTPTFTSTSSPPSAPPSTPTSPGAASQATTEITVRAQGATGTEMVELWVGPAMVERTTLTTDATDLTARSAEQGPVEVRFVNDGDTADGNRDVEVDYVDVDGVRYEAESPATVAAGFWDEATGTCQTRPATPATDQLVCNGFFRVAAITDSGVELPEPPAVAPEDAVPDDAVFVAVDGDDNGPGTRQQPWRTIQRAADQAEPGTTVVVRSGEYAESVEIERSGRAGAPIVFRNHPNERPIVRAVSGPSFHVQTPDAPVPQLSNQQRLDARPTSHVTIQGFELAGEDTEASLGWASGVTIDYSHDIRVRDNVIHGFPGGGVSSNQSDNLLVEGNTIEAVGRLGVTQYSGVSMYQPVIRDGSDIEPGFRLVMRDNEISGVRTDVTTQGKVFGADYRNVDDPADVADDPGSDGHYTDGNCVIIDDGRHTQNNSPFPVYTGWSLIEGNTCVDNLGRGVHVFLSDRVVARDNVLRANLAANRQFPPPSPFGFDPWGDYRWTGELNASRASEVIFENNLVDADGAFDRNSWESTEVVFRGNRYVGPGIETSLTEGASFENETDNAAVE